MVRGLDNYQYHLGVLFSVHVSISQKPIDKVEASMYVVVQAHICGIVVGKNMH